MASAKQQLITQYLSDHQGEQFNTVQLAKDLGISLPTLLSYIKNNPTQFSKVKHGWYAVHHEQPIMGTFTDDGDYIPAPIISTVLVTIIEDAPTHDAGPLVYVPNGPIPFPAHSNVLTNTSIAIDDTNHADHAEDIDTPLVQRVTSRPFDW